MISVRQLAKIAGVSPMTVSRALHDQPRVSAATRQRIKELAALYQFSTERLQRNVQSGKSGLIGCLIPDICCPFNMRVMKGVLDSCFAESLRVIPLETHCDIAHAEKALETMAQLKVEGLIIYSGSPYAMPQETLMAIWSREIPIVFLDSSVATVPVDRVHTDEAAIAAMALGYLSGLNHRQITYIEQSPATLRRHAIMTAFRRQGISVEHCIDLPVSPETWRARIVDEFSHPDHPTAVLCFNDTMAGTVLNMLLDMGLSVPDEVSVMGCGNLTLSMHTRPQLTTIEQWPEEIGRKAVELLLQRIDEDQYLPRVPQDITIAPQLIPRASCAPAFTSAAD